MTDDPDPNSLPSIYLMHGIARILHRRHGSFGSNAGKCLIYRLLYCRGASSPSADPGARGFLGTAWSLGVRSAHEFRCGDGRAVRIPPCPSLAASER